MVDGEQQTTKHADPHFVCNTWLLPFYLVAQRAVGATSYDGGKIGFLALVQDGSELYNSSAIEQISLSLRLRPLWPFWGGAGGGKCGHGPTCSVMLIWLQTSTPFSKVTLEGKSNTLHTYPPNYVLWARNVPDKSGRCQNGFARHRDDRHFGFSLFYVGRLC